jgi:hypothetical protein
MRGRMSGLGFLPRSTSPGLAASPGWRQQAAGRRGPCGRAAKCPACSKYWCLFNC